MYCICNRISFLLLFVVLAAGLSHINNYYPSVSPNIKRLLFQGKRKENVIAKLDIYAYALTSNLTKFPFRPLKRAWRKQGSITLSNSLFKLLPFRAIPEDKKQRISDGD